MYNLTTKSTPEVYSETMKITQLPSVKTIDPENVNGDSIRHDLHNSCNHLFLALYPGEHKDARQEVFEDVQNLLTQDRNLAYTSLIEGIEGMKSNPMLPVDDCLYSRSCIDREVDKALDDIIEKVVKPLYGKRPGDNASTK